MPPNDPAPLVTRAQYDAGNYEEVTVAPEEVCAIPSSAAGVTWINVQGAGARSVVECVGQHLALRPPLLERLEGGETRPTFKDFGDYVYLALNVLSHDPASREVSSEQVSLLFSANLVITLSQGQTAAFDRVREDLRTGATRIRSLGADYLAYALMDEVVDGYFEVLEEIDEEIEDSEDRLLGASGPELMHDLYGLKRECLNVWRAVLPFREAANSLTHGGSPLLQQDTEYYFRDLYEHTVEVMETIETLRDIMASMFDMYLSSVSNRLNEIMKVLTIFAALFAPLTVLVGIYGMNFKHMPELEWPWAYPAVWTIMVIIAGVMLLWFRKKRFL